VPLLAERAKALKVKNGMELDADHATVANARIAHAVAQRVADEAERLAASAQMDLFEMEAAS
jgi:hypothetical protein